jgi:hypothetical protein
VTRVLSLVLVVLVTGLPAWAQPAAPTPKVDITGFIDTISSWSKNLNDSLVYRTGESQWYARNRGRFDIIGQLGKAKAVVGFEFDSAWGTTAVGGQDNTLAAGGVGVGQHPGASSAFDLNTDTQGSIETKWLYTEFVAPFMPFPTLIRLGAQPFAAHYKLAAYATGDFAGVNVDFYFNQNLKAHFTYVALEENLTGARRSLGFGRGDDWAIITSVELTPFKGLFLDIQPIYSFLSATGSTAGPSRSAVGGIGGTPGFTRRAIGGVGGLGLSESRHTIGVDARLRSGPFSVDPTFFYQFGTRDTDNPFGPAINSNVRQADISAFFVDVIAGWRTGPLLIEGRATYLSGNRPKDQLSRDVNYYQPLNTDTSFYGAGWGEIFSLGIDYAIGSLKGLGSFDSLDRHGRQQLALRAIYSGTPSFDVRALVSALWTARSVDTDGTTASGFSLAAPPMTCATHTANSAANPRGAGCNGDASYVGTEVNLGITWRFAPGLVFDLVGAVMFAGAALDSSEVLNGVLTKQDAKNIYAIASRIRYSF